MMLNFWHSRPYRKKRRKSVLTASLLILAVFTFVSYSRAWNSRSTDIQQPEAVGTGVPPGHPHVRDLAKFWRTIYEAILNNDPQCKTPPEVVIPEKLDIGYEDDHFHDRPDILWMTDPDIQRMKIAHQNFLDDLRARQLKLVYQKGTRGIITTVSDTQIPILLIQLRMLRSTGSALPVEVFLSKPTPYTDHICTNILPTLNATCYYYSDIFTTASTGVSVATYQYKIFAILFSTFDEILLLDCDAWPISNPDHLFAYPPFSTTGLVLWPDFWYASESPYFFNIAKIDHPPLLHERPATESGELMYSKSKHETSIMLAAYYNYYGPTYYYPLQSQGAPGQGDKETFGSAALALHENFYWVRTPVTAIGRMDSSGEFIGSAMVQYDPIVDYQHRPADASPLPPQQVPEPPGLDRSAQIQNAQHPGVLPKQSQRPKVANKPLFVHANFPKFDPRSILTEKPPRDSNGTWVRCWDVGGNDHHGVAAAAAAAEEWFGYDVERSFWRAIETVACEDLVGQVKPGEEARKVSEMKTCNSVRAYVDEVFGHRDEGA